MIKFMNVLDALLINITIKLCNYVWTIQHVHKENTLSMNCIVALIFLNVILGNFSTYRHKGVNV